MLVDRSGRVWAMRPDEMMVAQAMAAREAQRSGAPVCAAGEALEGSDFARVVDGVAVVPVRGLLMRQMSLFFWSYEEIARDIALAQQDPTVRSVVLDIDSPGGIAAGCGDFARRMRASGPKPVESFVGGVGASAAYWIAASARRVTLGSGAVVGSVGSVIEYVDLEPLFEKLGARIVRVVAEQSPNKRLDPTSPEGRAEMQAIVNATGASFVSALAAARGLSDAEVLARFGQGLMFDAGDAIRRGMADRSGTLDELIAEMADRDVTPIAVPAAAATQEGPMDWASITSAALREHRADLVTEIETAARAAGKAEGETGVSAAVAAERKRILEIEQIAVAGHEDAVKAAKEDGETTAAELALAILKADKAAGRKHIAALEAEDAAAAVKPAVPEAEAAADGATLEDRCKATWAKDARVRAEFGTLETFIAFERARETGRAKILSRA